MKHHYLPQFYLKGFADPETPQNQEPYVWVLRADEKEWKKRSPKNIAAETNYYANQGIEQMLSKVEGLAAPLIKKKILNRQELNVEEKATLAAFISLMWMRVPSQQENIGNFMTNVAQGMMDVLSSVYQQNPELLEEFKKEYKEKTGRSDLDQMKVEDLDSSKYEVKATRSGIVDISFSSITKVASILSEMGWMFLVSSPPNYFVTSDAPFFMIDPTNKDRVFGDGLAFDNIEVSIPLTKELALFASWKNKGEVCWLDVPVTLVEKINFRTLKRAKKMLIAPKSEFPGSTTALKDRIISQPNIEEDK